VVWGWFCSRHQGHISAEETCKYTDRFVKSWSRPYKYLGVTITITHLWRDDHSLLFQSWKCRHGALSAIEHATQIFTNVDISTLGEQAERRGSLG
jgi:hypothetical protein